MQIGVKRAELAGMVGASRRGLDDERIDLVGRPPDSSRVVHDLLPFPSAARRQSRCMLLQLFELLGECRFGGIADAAAQLAEVAHIFQSYAETYAILWNDNSMKVTATARELYEAINHKYALPCTRRAPPQG